MALELIEKSEVDDNWDWSINLSGVISICCCFFFMWLALLSDQVQRDPFGLLDTDSILQDSSESTQDTKESIRALRAMLHNLEGFADGNRNVIFNKRLSDINLPYLGSDLGQLQVTFNEDGGKNKKFTDNSLSLLTNLKSIYCNWNKIFTNKSLKLLTNIFCAQASFVKNH